MQSLFPDLDAKRLNPKAPLAERMRPQSLDEVMGQGDLLAPGSPFRRLIATGDVPSFIFWGPPGSGKTTLARLVAKEAGMDFIQLSAVSAGLAELRDGIQAAKHALGAGQKRTVVFIDEIHRFNKAQQDALLPHVEDGTIVLIGATTENPSFAVNAALLSRCKVFVLHGLGMEDLVAILRRALEDATRGFGASAIEAPAGLFEAIAQLAGGDARAALNALESLVQASPKPKGKKPMVLDIQLLKRLMQRANMHFDKTGEWHYNAISALHKSLRGSDASAGLYWLARMLEAGDDPIYVARRLVRFAAEDVGLADPQALILAVAVQQACQNIGMPECEVHLAELAAYLARAPKSVEVYRAYGEAKADAQATPNEPIPIHLRNAPTKLMKELGYGKDYKYNPDFDGPVDQTYLPDALKGKKYL